MKVLILTSDYPSQRYPLPSIFVHNQAKALKDRGVDIAVLVFDVRSIRKRRPFGFSQYEYDGVTVYRYSIPCGPIPQLLPLAAAKAVQKGFKRVLRLFGMPDLIHAHFTGAGFLANQLKKEYGVPYILTEHSSGLISGGKIDANQHSDAYDNANRLLAVGTALKDKMQQYTTNSIKVVPNILPGIFRFENATKLEKFTFVSVCRLDRNKHIDMVIDAFARLSKEQPNIALNVVGTGSESSKLKQQANSLGIDGAVNFLGEVCNQDMPDVYAQCHCFVLPSTFETFGVVYAEAASCGLPIIATDCGGPSDIVTPKNGLMIPRGDAAALYEAMKDIYTNYNNYNPAEISEETLGRFGEDVVAQTIIECYKDVSNG